MLFRSMQVFRHIAFLAETYPVSVGKAVSVTVVASATAGSPVIGVPGDKTKPTNRLVGKQRQKYRRCRRFGDNWVMLCCRWCCGMIQGTGWDDRGTFRERHLAIRSTTLRYRSTSATSHLKRHEAGRIRTRRRRTRSPYGVE